MAKTVIIEFETRADSIRIDNLVKYLNRTVGICDDRWNIKTYGNIAHIKKLPNGKIINTDRNLHAGEYIMPEDGLKAQQEEV